MAEVDQVTMTIDGHDFLVRARVDEPGVYDFDWLTGAPGYGFTSARSDRRPMGPAEKETSIRDFLTQINPVTGHID
jgi:hypothetical protein